MDVFSIPTRYSVVSMDEIFFSLSPSTSFTAPTYCFCISRDTMYDNRGIYDYVRCEVEKDRDLNPGPWKGVIKGSIDT